MAITAIVLSIISIIVCVTSLVIISKTDDDLAKTYHELRLTEVDLRALVLRLEEYRNELRSLIAEVKGWHDTLIDDAIKEVDMDVVIQPCKSDDSRSGNGKIVEDTRFKNEE